ncbi:MAG TPA: hypothetical protein VIV15_01205 [Anaerolineales bacterium]
MSETGSRPGRFLGTYFDRDAVLRVSRWANILSWVVVVIYAVDILLALGVFILQFARGFFLGIGFTDLMTNLLFILERPFRGIVYFVALQAISWVLLILMDMEEDMRQNRRG